MSGKRVREAEEAKRRKILRQRFKTIIRSVALNRIWLVDTDDQKMSLNVKKNIAMLVRTQRKIGMLTLAEKSLIRSHVTIRSIEDRRKLVTLMAGLTCFSKIPPKVRARLAPVIKFMYLGPGRKLMKEGDLPVTVYYILTGEVEVSKKVFDPLKNSFVDKVEAISGPGDCLGEIEMIEGCVRSNTYTTATNVELLIIFEKDFENILRPIIGKQWFDKKIALMSLDYFKTLNKEQIIAACKLGVLRQFDPLETIYYEDKGHLSYVHFVISGECMILQCLKMKILQRNAKKIFELVNISKDEKNTLFEELSTKDIMKLLKEENTHQTRMTYKSGIDVESEDITLNRGKVEKRQSLKRMDTNAIEISCGLAKLDLQTFQTKKLKTSPNLNNYLSNSDLSNANEDFRSSKYNTLSEKDTNYDSELDSQIEDNDNRESSNLGLKINKQNIGFKNTPVNNIGLQEDEKDFHEEKDNLSSSSFLVETENTPSDSGVLTVSETKKNIVTSKDYPKVENRFIDVGSITYGGIFGLGEKLEHRVIMARTTVQCLLLPRFWLFEKEQNPGNIWQRRRFYLDSTIPSRLSLFQDFLTTRKWQKFKKDLVESSLDKNLIANPTKIQDIPIICRIIEASED